MSTFTTGGYELPGEFGYMFDVKMLAELEEIVNIHVTKLVMIAGVMSRHDIKVDGMPEMFYEMGREREAKVRADFPTDPAEMVAYYNDLLVKAAEMGIEPPAETFSLSSK